MTPTIFKSKVVKNKKVTDKYLILEIEHIDPIEMHFEPGQFITINVGDKQYRTYSIASDYKNVNKMQLITNVEYDGIGSKYLKSLKDEDTISFIGPSGLLRLKDPYPEKLFFLATGTGVAPFIPMSYKLFYNNYKGEVNLYFGLVNKKENIADEVLSYFKDKISNFNYQICYSGEDFNDGQKYTTDLLYKNKSKLDNDANYYLCGNPLMIESAIKILNDCGIEDENIIFEKFIKSGK